jgi:hypothetical protein
MTTYTGFISLAGQSYDNINNCQFDDLDRNCVDREQSIAMKLRQHLRDELDIALYLTTDETEVQIAIWLQWHSYAMINF